MRCFLLIITTFDFMKYSLITVLILSINACLMPKDQENTEQEEHLYTNALIHETSPYLLQHAHNPVDWMPWGEAALEKAKTENKPLLISIGYSACHWCHVMEHESFEDTSVAKIMNANFVCIKIDREERPDIDQIYMNAVQLMTGSGGWPLNCFATPDGRPFFGGTYFPKAKWLDVLEQINVVYTDNPEKVEEYASQLTEGVKNSELIQRVDNDDQFSLDSLEKGINSWKTAFDPNYGGNNRAPKFPIPNNYDFLLNYYFHSKDEAIKEHVLLTLEKIAYGGINDLVGGGFARYSTDLQWKVPHFEKMLYDNAQLLSLYSKAYQLNKNPLYKKVVAETVQFIEEELTAENGALYSALDADSEGEEGKYYVWKKEELKQILGEDFEIAKVYFNINSYGLWEHENYVLIRDKSNEELAQQLKLDLTTFETKVESIKSTLKEKRKERIKPGLDDKSLTSWNALTIKGLSDAYLTFGEEKYLDKAIENASFILKSQKKDDGGLWHSYKEGRSTINGYLEDYCFTIEAFIALYEATFDESWLKQSKELADYVIEHFFDEQSGLFFFTNNNDPKLIARKTEITDNVIPSSNSSMAKGLFLLGKYFENEEYSKMSDQMLRNVIPQFDTYLPSYSNWGILLMQNSQAFYEVAICGKEAQQKAKELTVEFNPNKMLIGSSSDKSTLPLLELKWIDGQTTIYVCENKVCQLPVTESSKAIQQLKP